MPNPISIKPVTHLGTQNRTLAFKPQTVSVDFNGTDEKMRNIAGQLINVGNVYTWSMWIKPQAGTFAKNSRMFAFRQEAGLNSTCVFDLQGNQANNPFWVTMWDTNADAFKLYTWDSLFTQDVWGFITVTWDGDEDELLLYFNGSLTAPTTTPIDLSKSRTDGSNHIIVVGSNNAGPLEMDCRIHSTGLWNTVLGLNEHIVLYNGGDGIAVNWGVDSGNYVSSGSMQHWWRLGAVASDMGKDSGIQQGQGNINVGDDAIGISTANIVVDYPGI